MKTEIPARSMRLLRRTACRADLRSIVSFSGFAIAAQVSRFLPSVRLGSLLVSLVVCFRHLFSLREHETENAAFTIQSLSAKIRENHKKG